MKEAYLNDRDFENIIKMTKEKFYKQKAWK